VIDHFIADIETLSLPVMIVIPGVVINELDGYDEQSIMVFFANEHFVARRIVMDLRGSRDALPLGF